MTTVLEARLRLLVALQRLVRRKMDERERAWGWWVTFVLPDHEGRSFRGRVSPRARKRHGGPPPGWLPDGWPDPNAPAHVIRGCDPSKSKPIPAEAWTYCSSVRARRRR